MEFLRGLCSNKNKQKQRKDKRVSDREKISKVQIKQITTKIFSCLVEIWGDKREKIGSKENILKNYKTNNFLTRWEIDLVQKERDWKKLKKFVLSFVNFVTKLKTFGIYKWKISFSHHHCPTISIFIICLTSAKQNKI